MFNCRQLTEEDYPTLVEWWSANRFPSPAQDVLPEYGTGGLMVSKNGVDICAGFIYDTNSALAWLEYIVANFEVKNRQTRKEAIHFLVEKLCGLCSDKRAIFTSVKNPSLISHLKDCGFLVGSSGTTEMIKAL